MNKRQIENIKKVPELEEIIRSMGVSIPIGYPIETQEGEDIRVEYHFKSHIRKDDLWLHVIVSEKGFKITDFTEDINSRSHLYMDWDNFIYRIKKWVQKQKTIFEI
jgi:hypothetical protein